MHKCSLVLATAAAVLFAVAPARANLVDKGASGQGLLSDANFETGLTVNGIAVTPFDDQGTIYDIFQIPSDFTSGVSYTLTFADISAGYGVFDCGNGTNDFGLSEDDPPQKVVGPCTAEPVPTTGNPFVTSNEVGNTATITFSNPDSLAAPSTFYFWTTDANLLSIEPATVTTPEPSSLLLLAFGFMGLILFRRRLAAP